MFEYSQDDVARNIVVEGPVTNLYEITGYEKKPSKDQTSTNHVITYKCIGSEGDKYNGQVINVYYSEKAPAMAFPFLRAMGVELQKGGGKIDFTVFVGRKVFLSVKPGDYNGQPNNEVTGYAPFA